MSRLAVFFVVLAAGICSIAAQSCNCNDLRKCAEDNRKAKNEAKTTCESSCVSKLNGTVNGPAVLSCFSQKRAAKDLAEAAEDSCIFSKICTGGVVVGGQGSAAVGGQGRGRHGGGSSGHGGGKSAGKAQELQQFKQCVRDCMQKNQGASGSAESCVSSQTGCSSIKDSIKGVKNQCRGDSSQWQNAKMMHCQCLFNAGVKSLTCTAPTSG